MPNSIPISDCIFSLRAACISVSSSFSVFLLIVYVHLVIDIFLRSTKCCLLHLYLCKYINTNGGGLCCFRFKRFINFQTSVLLLEERETILTMQTLLNARHILWFLRPLSVEIRKTQLHLSTAEIQLYDKMTETQLSSFMVQFQLSTLFFKILKFSGLSLPSMTSSEIQTHFLSPLSYPLRTSVNYNNCLYTWAHKLNSSKPNQTEW